MACYKITFRGDLDRFKGYIQNEIINGSASATLEEATQTETNGVVCCTQVYERYSYAGGNRLSLTLNLVAFDGEITLTAITSGGSRAFFFKMNTIGEETFLDKTKQAVEAYIQRNRE